MPLIKELTKQWREVEKKLGLKAIKEIENYLYTLIRKIEDLEKSRNNWRNKYFELKNAINKKPL